MALAVARHPVARHVMHYDERGSAFFALGYGRATGKAAAWITTSGTAAANGLPAAVEAFSDRAPLLLLTADRPPELRKTGANQTINQVGLFGKYARWTFDLPPQEKAIDAEVVLTTVDQACNRALEGPVHLNCMFRESLANEAHKSESRASSAWRRSADPYTQYLTTRSESAPADIEHLADLVRDVRRGLVVAGRLATKAEGRAAIRLAERLGWPILPDIGSQVRVGHGEASPYALFDLCLGSEAFSEGQGPDAVVHLGGRCVSKRLLLYMQCHRPTPFIVAHPSPDRLDPLHLVTHRVDSGIEAFSEAMCAALKPSGESSWRASWREASAGAEAAMSIALDGQGPLSEPFVARAISRLIPEGHALFMGSSMPVRDVDRFATAAGAPIRVAANRGASGIDGTIATAAGFAEGLNTPVTVVLGDLALLHDLNSLALAKDRPLIVVVINNDGGGIFHFLALKQEEDIFERCFGAPHGLKFDAAARMYALDYAFVDSREAFIGAYTRARDGSSAALIEVRTHRKENERVHRELQSLVDAAI